MPDQTRINAYDLIKQDYPDLDQLVEILTPKAPDAIITLMEAWKSLYGAYPKQEEVVAVLSKVIELDVRFSPVKLKLSWDQQKLVADVFASELHRRGISKAREQGKAIPSSE
jgi:hypothetical protein